MAVKGKITKAEMMETAEFMVEVPPVAAEIFRLNAVLKVKYADIAPLLADQYDGVRFTETVIRKIIHRMKPFQCPDIYTEVDPEHERLVTGRFRKNVKRKARKKVDNGPEKHLPVLLDVLTARVEYQKKLKLAVDSGMSESAVVAWVSVVAEGNLEQGTE